MSMYLYQYLYVNLYFCWQKGEILNVYSSLWLFGLYAWFWSDNNTTQEHLFSLKKVFYEQLKMEEYRKNHMKRCPDSPIKIMRHQLLTVSLAEIQTVF